MVGQIIPWNFPILMAVWKLAPALAAGNCVVLKPAEQTPMSIMVLMDLIGDLLPPGVLNVVNGFGVEAGKPLAPNKRIAKIAFTGETTTGRLIMQYASENLIPVTLELGGKSPNIFFADVMAADDAFFDKALEGFAMFALNQGEVCTCPSRALVQRFDLRQVHGEGASPGSNKIKQGNPLELSTMIGAQASNDQLEKILSYVDIGKKEGAKLLDRRRASSAQRRALGRLLHEAHRVRGQQQDAHLPGGDLRPRAFGHHLQGRGRGARRSPTTRSTASAPACGPATSTAPIAWAAASRRDGCGPIAITSTRRMRRSAATRSRASGARTHKMMLDHYQQTKNMLVSYSPKALGFF